MIPTVEVRWFYRGAAPEELHQWFALAGGEIEPFPARTDRYFYLPDNDSLGIKLRQGRLELKQLEAQHGLFSFHERVAGLIQGWRKWSFPLAESHAAYSPPLPAWIGVKKTRWLSRFTLDADKRLTVVAAAESALFGCQVEVTNIIATETEWWSLALEAYGDEPNLLEGLGIVARHLFHSGEVPALAPRASYSYPRWLMKLSQEHNLNQVKEIRR